MKTKTNQVKITEITPGRFKATVAGHPHIIKGNARAIKRRIANALQMIEEKEAAEREAERIRNAPKKTCPRCGGSGYIDAYMHIAHGICYKCGGSGTVIIEKKGESND